MAPQDYAALLLAIYFTVIVSRPLFNNRGAQQ